MTRAQKKKTNSKDYHKDGSDRHRAAWTTTQFKYISQRGNLFQVRLRAKGLRINRTFPNLVDAQDFVSSSGFDLITKTDQKRESMTDMVEKTWHDLDWVAQRSQIPSAAAETDSYHHD